MPDVFELDQKTAKEQLINQFGQWWGDKEIRTEIIPAIVGKNIRGSVNGALRNYSENENRNKKEFAEILYDLVGQNFLVNKDKSIRLNFLRLILGKKAASDPSFQDRFLQNLVMQGHSAKPGVCRTCGAEWQKGDKMYRQTLGLKKPITCTNYRCVTSQQRAVMPGILESAFEDFIQGFDMRKDYKRFCKSMLDEFDFPREVMLKPTREIKLLPETIRPMGKFLPLYDYQASIGTKIRGMLEDYKLETSRALVALPTGAGKTRLVVETLVEWINRGKQGKKDTKFIVWVSDRNELCQQAFDTFADVFRHRGRKDSSLKLHPIYGGNAKNIGDILYQYSESSEDMDEIGEISEENGVIIGTIQSLYKLSQNEDQGHLPELGSHTSVVIIDEAHHAVPSNKSYTAVLRALGFTFRGASKGKSTSKNKTCLIGLTATPFRGGMENDGTEELLKRFGRKERILWPPFSESANERENIPPYAHLYVQKTAFPGEPIKLYGEDSYDKDGRIAEYHFTIERTGGNQEKDVTIYDRIHQESNIDYTFERTGRYTVRLVVSDDEGAVSRNLADRVIDVLSIEERTAESNAAAMKRLYRHLIKREILSTPHHYIIDSKVRFFLKEGQEKQFKMFHDISDSTVKEIGNDSHRNLLITRKIDSLVNKEGRKSILFFACSIEHSKLISFILDATYGIRSASIDHTTSPEERDEIIHDFRMGRIAVLCNYGILSTGFDSPRVDCVFVSRPTFSHLLYNQMTGRGLRGPRNGGTPNCVIVDISDNIQLVSDGMVIEQSWRLFEYIYDTVYDERKSDTEQKCYGCFGTGKMDKEEESIVCRICNGARTYPPRTDTVDLVKKRDIVKEMQEIQAKYPKYSLEQIKAKVRSNHRYDEAFRRREK